MKTKIKRFLVGMALNAATVYVTWLALFMEVEWADNLLTFYCWLNAGLACLALLALDQLRPELSRKGPSVPPWWSFPVDLAICGALVATGRFVLGSLYLWATVIERIAYAKPPPKN